MRGTELKTDASQRWMMYNKEAYEGGRIFLTTEQKQVVEEGKRFTERANAEVWARDTTLVQRARSFLGTNFHWHQRLSKSGSDVEIIETLQSMIRGESVVLIAEQSCFGSAMAAAAQPQPKMPSFRESLMTEYGMTYDAATAYIERYSDMVDRVHAVSAPATRADLFRYFHRRNHDDDRIAGRVRPFPRLVSGHRGGRA